MIAVALSLQAYLDVVGVNNGAIGQSLAIASATVPGQITRTNADGTTDIWRWLGAEVCGGYRRDDRIDF